MTAQIFYVSETNPNDNCGGGGCVCSYTKHTDCKPPYIIFPHTEMDEPVSPNVVICGRCAEMAFEASKGERLQVGEVTPIVDATALDVVDEPDFLDGDEVADI